METETTGYIHRAPALIADASIEISQLDADKLGGQRFGLPAGTQAFIPWLPFTRPDDLIRSAASLLEAGFQPVPHIAARRLDSSLEADTLLRRLSTETRVRRVLLIGGDLATPAGPFGSSLDLLRSGLLEKAGIGSVGFAAYPEGHPDIPAAALEQSLTAKLRHAADVSLEAFIVSQFCFDGAAIANWVTGLRNSGIHVPVRIGVAGPTKLRKLLAMGLRCGIGNSLRVLRGKAGAVSALVSSFGPDEVVRDYLKANSTDGIGAAGEVSLHLFAFGGVESSAHWICSHDIMRAVRPSSTPI